MNWLRLGLFALAAMGATVSARDAFAFACSRTSSGAGPSLVWVVRDIPWSAGRSLVSSLGDPLIGEEELQKAFSAWASVDCTDLSFPFSGVVNGLEAGFDESFGATNENVLVLVESDWRHDPTAIAVTTNIFDGRTGVVRDADIEFNGVNFDFVRATDSCLMNTPLAMDLRNVATHEIGHMIGLDHPPFNVRFQDTTMFASAPPCETQKQTLSLDDQDGICSIYPQDGLTSQCFEPEAVTFEVVEADPGFGGCQCVRSPKGLAGVMGTFGLLLVLGMMAAVRRFGVLVFSMAQKSA